MFDYSRIPSLTMETLKGYIEKGIPTGSFCEAVLSNDLFDAVGRADEQNQKALVDIVAWLYNESPAMCHGSRERYKTWIKHRGKEGYKEYYGGKQA